MFLKGFKRVLVALLVGVLFMGSVTAHASANKQNTQESVNIINDEISMYNKKGIPVNIFSTNDVTIYTVEITDEKELEKYDKTGKGKLESRTITYILPKKNNSVVKYELDTDAHPLFFANYTISDWKYDGNRHYDTTEGTPFRIEGKANFTHTVSTSTTWKLYGEGSGKVKGAVELKIGGEIGETNEKEWQIEVDVPEGYYRDFEVWEYLTKYTFNVLRNNKSYSTGSSAYKPNGGRKLTNDLYRK